MKLFSKISLLLIGILFLTSPLWSIRLKPGNYQGGRSWDAQERVQRNTSSVATMFGEMRTSLSDIIFLKTERYIHSGVGYAPHLKDKDLLSLSDDVETEKVSVQTKFSHDNHAHEEELPFFETQPEEEVHDHSKVEYGNSQGEKVETIILSKERDFRGILGDLHREVKPWLDPSEQHRYTKGTELLPWYRVMTLADPKNVRGYVIGGWWLKNENTQEGIRFLNEGIQINPESFELRYILGQIYYQIGKDVKKMGVNENHPDFLKPINKAKKAYREAALLVMKYRPENPEKDPNWADYTETDALASMRLSVFLEEKYGSRETALQYTKQYLQTIPEDQLLRKLLVKLSN